MTASALTSKPRWHVRIFGGLGNQLFQYGAALLLARRWGGGITLADHTQRYSEARTLTLTHAVHLPSTHTPKWVDAALGWRVARIPGLGGINDGNVSDLLRRDRKPLGLGGHYLLDGYFQDCWTTQSVGDLIDAASRVAKPVTIGSHIALHIRGGDFLRLPAYQVATPEFYREALLRLTDTLGDHDLEVEVITDDEPYARSVLGTMASDRLRFVYPDSGSMAADFERLRTARARIIGNSTFAWWAAALRAAPSLTVSCAKWTIDRTRAFNLPDEIQIG